MDGKMLLDDEALLEEELAWGAELELREELLT